MTSNTILIPGTYWVWPILDHDDPEDEAIYIFVEGTHANSRGHTIFETYDLLTGARHGRLGEVVESEYTQITDLDEIALLLLANAGGA